MIHLVEHSGGARRDNLIEVIRIGTKYQPPKISLKMYFFFYNCEPYYELTMQLLERSKRNNWGVEFVWVSPGWYQPNSS